MQIFLREGVEVSAWVSGIAPAMALLPEVRRYMARQIDDLDSIVELGVDLASEGIERPTKKL